MHESCKKQLSSEADGRGDVAYIPFGLVHTKVLDWGQAVLTLGLWDPKWRFQRNQLPKKCLTGDKRTYLFGVSEIRNYGVRTSLCTQIN